MDRIYNQNCIQGMKEHVRSNSIDLVISDSPFAINGDTTEKHYNRDNSKVVKGYVEIPQEEYPQFCIDWINQVDRVLRPGGSAYIFSGYTNLKDILIALSQTSLVEVNHLIWKYNFGVYTKNKYVSSHYHILYCVKPPISKKTFNTYSRFDKNTLTENGNKANYKDREDVWSINREYHPNEMKTKNQLPLELVGKIIDYSSNEGDLILDPFCGSFSALKVAIASKRKFIGFEISKPIFDYGMKSVVSVA